MPQSDARSLLLNLIDEIENLKVSEELLNIGMDQLDRDDNKSVTRLILLVEIFMSRLDGSMDEINCSLKRLRNTSAFKQSDKL
jgi:hypothetical protein